MKPNFSLFICFVCFLTLQQLHLPCFAQDFDFFYFVQQWPGAYCDSRQSCCYPKTGKPAADFGIHGLWPNYKSGGWPQNCNPDSEFDESQISDLLSNMQTEWPTLSCPSNDGVKFWTHEWTKHGTCAESELDQHDYFHAALKLKQKANLLHALSNAGIKPNDEFYGLREIKKAIEEAIGFTPGIECNKDSSHNSQLYQIYLCVDTSGAEFIECPVLPHGRCDSRIQFPKF
ncbi:PREDICTED: ribonuclease 3-like [Tarenaya hassleriana]|uniref:ribonuclease 3-like n=1 Tax=Tarenaya hassleriana TaxID=28532 RepID=UPI00053C5935|nr:PREDICTED: ribonuclease 3-like [Tarenaya hassleriana]